MLDMVRNTNCWFSHAKVHFILLIIPDAAHSANGFSLHCNGTTTNGVTNGVSKHLHSHTSKHVVSDNGESGDHKPAAKK